MFPSADVAPLRAGPPAAPPTRPVQPIGPDLVLDLVRDIAARLHDTALWHDGRALWLGDRVESAGSDARVIHGACGRSFYDGTAGIGWFLAHVAAETGDEHARIDALGALRHALDGGVSGAGLGFHEGIAGIGWAVLDGGLVIDDPIASRGLALFVDAVERGLSTTLPDELIQGRSGLILAALSAAALARERLGREEEARFLVDGAVRLGRLVLASADRGGVGWTWPSTIAETDDEPALCSLAHGGSGPILACAHLAAVTEAPDFAIAAIEGARAERAWLRPDQGWPDLRGFGRDALERGDRPVFPVQWCHGAGGIGLARMRAWRLLGEAELLADATLALRLAAREVGRMWQAPPGTYEANFSLCHGAGGLIDLFVSAAEELGDRTWLGAAAALVQAGAAHRAAGFAWQCGIRDGTESPSLMLGLAGAGTALLRLARPDRVTSPLTVAPGGTGGGTVATAPRRRMS